MIGIVKSGYSRTFYKNVKIVWDFTFVGSIKIMDEDLEQLLPTTSEEVDNRNRIRPSWGIRHLQVLFYFLLLTYTYSMRSVLSVAIVAMNDNSTSSNPNIEVNNSVLGPHLRKK
uniref:Uncharacterized protein LOC114332618 isoform X1 n=2 Tax=Diabrotica virgifera virgifera TaxID=50390 RepID=A0A6P7FTV4_DIAVI